MNLAQRLCDRIKESRKRVLVMGDAMIDRWVHGVVEECQDNCPKFIQQGAFVRPGGAANALQCLDNWGTTTELFSFGIPQQSIKTRFVVNNKIVYRHDDDGPSLRADRKLYDWTYRSAVEFINCAGAVLLSDYAKGFLTPEFIQQVVGACQKRSIPCVADAKRAPEMYAGAILKCNTDYQHKYNQDLGRLVFDAEKGQRLVVTTGAMNPIIWDGDGPLGLGYDLPLVKCINYVGAGDCFAAHLTLALAYGFSLKESAALAHSAGRVYVQHPHNRAPWPKEVAEDMEKQTIS